MRVLRDTVPEGYNGKTIYTFLHSGMGLSATLIKRVKWGFVFLDGQVVNMKQAVKCGQTVEVHINEEKASDIRPIPFPLDMLYEDEYILLVNKPCNMPTHPSRGNSLPTLAEGVAAYLGEPFVFRAINRLDRDTSGIVLIAKDQHSANILSKSMKSGGFKKKYLAITDGIPNPKAGIIDAPIERECEGSIKRVVRSDGKRAITEYKVILADAERAMVEFTLYTGRTHQIRVHSAHIGTPLYADFLYGTRKTDESYYLHAYYLSFTHPISGEAMEIKSSPPFSLRKD